MRAHFSFFYPLLLLLLGFFFFFNTNTVYGTSHCKLIKQGLDISYCGGSLSMCTVNRLNSDCNNKGSVKTGDFCCTKVLEVKPGKNYDSCDGTIAGAELPAGGPGDCVTRVYTWYCCLNPTPTPTPTPTPN